METPISSDFLKNQRACVIIITKATIKNQSQGPMLKRKISFIILAIALVFSSFNALKKVTFAESGYVEDSSVSLSVSSVSKDGATLEKSCSNGDPDYECYYLSPRTQSTVDIDFVVEGMEEGHEYYLYIYDDGQKIQLTSDDNGKEVTFSTKPNSMSGKTSAVNAHLYKDGDYILSSAVSMSLHFQSDTIGTDNIVLESISQNGVELANVDGHYETSDYTSPISLTYRLENLNVGGYFSTFAYIGSGSSSGNEIADESIKIFTKELSLNKTKKDSYLSISMFSYDSNSQYYSDRLSVTVSINDPSFVELGDFYIDSVKQGENVITPEFDEENNQYVYTISNYATYSIEAHTAQAISDLLYTVSYGSSYPVMPDALEKTGAELVSGISLSGIRTRASCRGTCHSSSSYIPNYIQINGSSTHNLMYNDGEKNYYVQFKFDKDENSAQIKSLSLGYANYPERNTLAGKYETTVDLRYHNEDNPLKIHIEGVNFEDDSDYPFIVTANQYLQGGTYNVAYKHEFTKRGSELNAGTDITLDGFTMELMNETNMLLDADTYSFTVLLGNEFYTTSYDYGYENLPHLFGGSSAAVVDESGSEIFTHFMASTPGLGIAIAEEGAHTHFVISGLPENETFDCIIKRELRSTVWPYEDITDAEVVKSVTLTGKQIAEGMFEYQFEDQSEEGYVYYILVKNGSGVITWTAGGVRVNTDFVGIAKIGATINSQPLNVEYNYQPFFSISRNETVQFLPYGKNFDEDESYSVTMAISICSGNVIVGSCKDPIYEETKLISGADLNTGSVSFEYPYSEELDLAVQNEQSGLYQYASARFTVDDETVSSYYATPNVNFQYVDGTGFSVKLTGDDTFDEEAVIYLSVDDYKNLSEEYDGIAGLMGDLEFDEEKLELVSVEGLNDFELVNGDHYVLHNINGVGAAEGTNILKITFRNKTLANGDSTTIRFTNISGSDGENDLEAADVEKNISFSEPVPTIDYTPYSIDEDNIITGVPLGTTAESFLNNFELSGGASLKALSPDETELSAQDKTGTGTILQLLDKHEAVADTFTVVVKGDINGDGEITITDLVKAKRHLAGLENYTGVYQIAGDVSNTGAISITDVVKICRHIAGLERIVQ